MSTSRRRQRYTVVLAGENAPIVCLTYSEQDAVNYYNRRGKTVVQITKGDFRKQARVAQAKAEGGYTIDQKALKDAIARLGLKLPVKLRFHNRVGNTNGNYRHGVTHHNIMIKRYLTPEQASKTLWHELTHAMQAERAGDYAAWVFEYSQQRKRYSYLRRSIEIEARHNADMYAPIYPLVK